MVYEGMENEEKEPFKNLTLRHFCIQYMIIILVIAVILLVLPPFLPTLPPPPTIVLLVPILIMAALIYPAFTLPKLPAAPPRPRRAEYIFVARD